MHFSILKNLRIERKSFSHKNLYFIQCILSIFFSLPLTLISHLSPFSTSCFFSPKPGNQKKKKQQKAENQNIQKKKTKRKPVRQKIPTQNKKHSCTNPIEFVLCGPTLFPQNPSPLLAFRIFLPVLLQRHLSLEEKGLRKTYHLTPSDSELTSGEPA